MSLCLTATKTPQKQTQSKRAKFCLRKQLTECKNNKQYKKEALDLKNHCDCIIQNKNSLDLIAKKIDIAMEDIQNNAKKILQKDDFSVKVLSIYEQINNQEEIFNVQYIPAFTNFIKSVEIVTNDYLDAVLTLKAFLPKKITFKYKGAFDEKGFTSSDNIIKHMRDFFASFFKNNFYDDKNYFKVSTEKIETLYAEFDILGKIIGNIKF